MMYHIINIVVYTNKQTNVYTDLHGSCLKFIKPDEINPPHNSDTELRNTLCPIQNEAFPF